MAFGSWFKKMINNVKNFVTGRSTSNLQHIEPNSNEVNGKNEYDTQPVIEPITNKPRLGRLNVFLK